jgi:hypothetical protein
MEKYLNLNLPPPHPLLSLLFCLWWRATPNTPLFFLSLAVVWQRPNDVCSFHWNRSAPDPPFGKKENPKIPTVLHADSIVAISIPPGPVKKSNFFFFKWCDYYYLLRRCEKDMTRQERNIEIPVYRDLCPFHTHIRTHTDKLFPRQTRSRRQCSRISLESQERERKRLGQNNIFGSNLKILFQK